MRLIIHGGIHRTGTTTIQRFLAENRELLRLQGFIYPFNVTNHQRLAWDIFAGRLSGDELLRLLRAEISNAEPETVLLSGEDFCIHTDLSWLEPVCASFDVHAHFYLRRQDVWLMSWYNQHVKWPFDKRKSGMSSEDFLGTLDDYYWLDFHWLAKKWAGALGKEKVHLHLFDNDRNVITDFCEQVNLRLRDSMNQPKVENSSLPPEVLEFVRHFGIQSFAPAERTRFLNAVRKVCGEQQFAPTNVYSPAIRNLILARFAESNREVAVEYFSMPDGKLFSDDQVGPDEPFARPRLPESAILMKRYVVPLVRAIIMAPRHK